MRPIADNFTSPEFADLLKRYGIEVETPFYYGNYLGSYWLIADSPLGGSVCPLFKLGQHQFDVENKPAYMLSQVLRWLPEYMEGKGALLCKISNDKAGYIDFRKGGTWKPIEDLVTQGLREKWLAKEMILKNAKV